MASLLAKSTSSQMCPQLVSHICTRPEVYEGECILLRTRRTVPRLGTAFWPDFASSAHPKIQLRNHHDKKRIQLTLNGNKYGSKYHNRKDELLDRSHGETVAAACCGRTLKMRIETRKETAYMYNSSVVTCRRGITYHSII